VFSDIQFEDFAGGSV